MPYKDPLKRKAKDTVICTSCRAPFQMSHAHYISQTNKGVKEFRCQSCRNKALSELRKNEWNQKSDEDKALALNKLGNGHYKWYNNLSEEDKALWITKSKEWMKSASDETMQLIRLKQSAAAHKFWDTLSDDDRTTMLAKLNLMELHCSLFYIFQEGSKFEEKSDIKYL